MANQSNNGGRGGPWGGGHNPGADIENLVRQGQARMRQFVPGGGARRMIVFVLLALVGLGAWTAYYTVPSDSVAVVQRFGKYLREVPPGLHFKLPLGIDAATIVPVKRQLKQESQPYEGADHRSKRSGRGLGPRPDVSRGVGF